MPTELVDTEEADEHEARKKTLPKMATFQSHKIASDRGAVGRPENEVGR